jgi:hypothetical protein
MQSMLQAGLSFHFFKMGHFHTHNVIPQHRKNGLLIGSVMANTLVSVVENWILLSNPIKPKTIKFAFAV